jgi:hypothetical protein
MINSCSGICNQPPVKSNINACFPISSVVSETLICFSGKLVSHVESRASFSLLLLYGVPVVPVTVRLFKYPLASPGAEHYC